ncbi:hypothetical protein [Actinomycetospora flava]|uniref:Uncharacterized protein n=1 Tax=Actinomycetospora flava TaxID=3129232 RepID=A0ABU8M315_9PSEU
MIVPTLVAGTASAATAEGRVRVLPRGGTRAGRPGTPRRRPRQRRAVRTAR